MALSAEHIAKLKEHVKNKLIEIGAYVDDQLPDYVMIMVTNKKSEKQMIEDLDLFLGGADAAAKFIEWLESMIKRVTTGESSTSASKTSSKTKSAASRKSSAANSSLNQTHEGDELAIQIEADEFNEDFGDESASKSRQRKTSSSVQSQVSVEKPVTETTPVEPAKLTRSTSGQMQSCVGAVIKRDQEPSRQRHESSDGGNDEDSGSELRRKRKLSGSGSSLSSVVKVSERKYAVPRSMQPNKNILLKAVDAANTSVQNGGKSKSIADLKLEEIRAKRKSMPANEPVEVEERREQPTLQSKRLRTSYSTSVVTGHYEQATDRRKAVIDENSEAQETAAKDQRKVQIEAGEGTSALKALDTNNQSEPKFIVTLTGLDEDKFSRSNSSKSGPLAHRLGPANQVDDEDMIEGDVITAGEEMDLLDEEFNGEQEERMDNENTDEQVQKKKLTRCMFWPQCDKGDQCAYLHPNKPCIAFPNCQFGQQCHFQHPPCRYGAFCNRIDCPYTHMVKKGSLGAAPKAAATLPAAEVTVGEQSMDATQTPTAPVKNITPKVTINKIQPIYSLVNKPAAEAATTTVDESGEKPAGEQAAAPTFAKASPVTQAKYRHPAGGKPFFRGAHFSNQFSFVNRQTATVPAVPINCKFGVLCKNAKCPYIHPASAATKQSQFKWTASSSQPAAAKPDAPSSEEAASQVIIS